MTLNSWKRHWKSLYIGVSITHSSRYCFLLLHVTVKIFLTNLLVPVSPEGISPGAILSATAGGRRKCLFSLSVGYCEETGLVWGDVKGMQSHRTNFARIRGCHLFRVNLYSTYTSIWQMFSNACYSWNHLRIRDCLNTPGSRPCLPKPHYPSYYKLSLILNQVYEFIPGKCVHCFLPMMLKMEQFSLFSSLYGIFCKYD